MRFADGGPLNHVASVRLEDKELQEVCDILNTEGFRKTQLDSAKESYTASPREPSMAVQDLFEEVRPVMLQRQMPPCCQVN